MQQVRQSLFLIFVVRLKLFSLLVLFQLRDLSPRYAFGRCLMQLALMDAIQAHALCRLGITGASESNIQGINFNNHQPLLKRPRTITDRIDTGGRIDASKRNAVLSVRSCYANTIWRSS